MTADLSELSSYGVLDKSGLGASMPIPFELRTGASYHINEETLISSDFSVDGPVRDGSVLDAPETLQDISRGPGVYYSNSTQRRWTPNAAIGVQHKFGKAVVDCEHAVAEGDRPFQRHELR